MDKPADGPVGTYGPFIRNAQEIAPGVFLVESQRGTKGRGKVWNPAIFYTNPHYAPNAQSWHEKNRFMELGYVRVGTGYRGAGMFKVVMWTNPHYDPANPHNNKRRYVEGFFEDQLLAVQFMVRNAQEMIKP